MFESCHLQRQQTLSPAAPQLLDVLQPILESTFQLWHSLSSPMCKYNPSPIITSPAPSRANKPLFVSLVIFSIKYSSMESSMTGPGVDYGSLATAGSELKHLRPAT